MKKVLAVILAIGLCVAPQAGYAYQYGSGWNERDLEMRKFSIDGDKDDGLAFDGNNDDVNDMVLSPTGSLILGDVTYPYADGTSGQSLVTDGAGSLSWASLQPLATNLTSLSGLTYASDSFVKMTGANTFSLDTNTYLTSETDPVYSAWILLNPTSGTNSGDQSVFKTISTTSGTNPEADTTTDTLTLTAGSGITITGDAAADSVTIANTGVLTEVDPNAVLLAGRAGGQTIKGGTQAGDDLSFWTNATGTVGSYFFTDLTDNGFIKTSGGTGLLSVDTTTYLSAEADTLDAVTDRGATTTNNITIGTLTSGVEDTTRGIAYFHGPEAGYDFGGSAFFYTGADHDTTIDNYGIIAHQDDLLIGPSNDTDALKLVGSDLYLTGGNLSVSGDLTVSGDGITMTTNTIGAVLVGDGTNFNPVVMSADASIATDGAVTVADDSHAHTGSTISGLDISGDTNLAVSAPITLTDDTLGITVDKDIVGGVGISGGADNVLSGADGDVTITFDATELDAVTWSDNANASNAWTFDVSGTDHTMTAGDGLMTFSHDVTVGDDLTVTDDLLLGSGSVINFNSGNATITHSAGILTFNVFPVTPSAAPDADYEVANKKFVDDHNWDAGDITSGTLVHERGGLEADVSAYDGFVHITGGATSAIKANAGTDITADLEEEAHASEHAVGAADTVFPADPGADRYLMWDDDPGALVWAEVSASGDVTDVGNCSGGACLDGSSDGGTSISLYDGNSHKTTITAGDSTGDLVFTLPTTDGDANQVLKTDGSGVLSWVANGSFDSTTVDATTWSDGANASNIWTFDVSGTDTTLTFGNDVITVGGSLTVTTGKNITLGSTQWNASGADTIDGEVIANDTIDDDSIDFSDVTAADITMTDAAAITASGLITANANLDVKNGATSAGVISIYEDSDDGAHKTTISVPALAGDVAYVLPADDGDAGEQLQTDGSGNLTWEAAGGVAAAGWTDGGSYIKTTTDGDNIIIGGATAVGTDATSTIAIEVGTPPSTSPADMIQLYAQDVSPGYGSDLLGAQTSNSSPYTVSAGSEYSATYAAWKAFDGNDSTRWTSTDADGVTSWIKIDFGTTKIVTKYTALAFNTARPTEWTFEGSNTGSFAGEQTTLDSQTGQNIGTVQTYTFSNSTGYRYYRMNITAGTGNNATMFTLTLHESIAATSELKVRDEAGNITTISPHNFTDIPQDVKTQNDFNSDGLAWTYHSEKNGKSITVDMFRAIRSLEKLTGEQLIFTNEEASVDKTPGDITLAELVTAKADLETAKTELATTKTGLEKAQADIAKLTTDVTDLKSAEPIEEPIK